MLPHFYYSPDILGYDFGPGHPLKPERLRRTIELLSRYGVVPIDPGPGRIEDLLRVHDEEYVMAVHSLDPLHPPAPSFPICDFPSAGSSTFRRDSSPQLDRSDPARNEEGERQNPHPPTPSPFGKGEGEPFARNLHEREHWEFNPAQFGFGKSDNPIFPGMFEASLAYVSATVKAAEAVRDGAPLAFGIGGGLHHAHRDRASGFCIFDDPAIASHILLETFQRVAYVDIDVHHGDGVQWMFFDEPRVLTCSIHEEGRTLFPGTGFVEETGVFHSSLNVPVMARTTGDVWLSAFENGILPGIEAFAPQAIVLQLGTDTHGQDPLGHVQSTSQQWLGAVKRILELGLPIVAVGGGGYNLQTVPRMWTAACLTLGGIEFEDRVPDDLAERWGMPTYCDPEPESRGVGAEFADGMVDWLKRNLHPIIGK